MPPSHAIIFFTQHIALNNQQQQLLRSLITIKMKLNITAFLLASGASTNAQFQLFGRRLATDNQSASAKPNTHYSVIVVPLLMMPTPTMLLIQPLSPQRIMDELFRILPIYLYPCQWQLKLKVKSTTFIQKEEQ